MVVSQAQAVWEGTLREGRGEMHLKSGAFRGEYTFASRFEGKPGTNPEELIAAAHAGCFSMALAAGLERAGYPPKRVATEARVHFGVVEGKATILRIELRTEAEVPGISPERFQELAEEAKQNCPVSRALAGVPEILLEARLLPS